MSVHQVAPHGVHAAHAPDDSVAIDRHILAERRAVAEQIVGDRAPAHDLSQLRRPFGCAHAFDRSKRRRALESGAIDGRKSLPSEAAGSREPCMRFASAHPVRRSRSRRKWQSPAAHAAARSHRLPERQRHGRPIPRCGSRENSCARHRASATMARRGWPRKETCGSCRCCSHARTPRLPIQSHALLSSSGQRSVGHLPKATHIDRAKPMKISSNSQISAKALVP